MAADITLDLDDVELSHQGRRCWLVEVHRSADVRCPRCGTNLADAQQVDTTHGLTNHGGTYGLVEIDATIVCDCDAELYATIRWDDI